MSGVDILVCTALASEYVEAKSVSTQGFGRDGRTVPEWLEQTGNGTRYEIGRLQVDGRNVTIGLAHARRMAGIEMAMLARDLVLELSPGCLAMCGVCAGRPGDAALGDVVFATRSYQYDEGKLTGAARFEGDHMVVPVSDELLDEAQRFDTDSLPSYTKTIDDDEVMLWLLESLALGIDPKQNAGLERYVGKDDARWARLLQRLSSDGYAVQKPGYLELTARGAEHLKTSLYGRLNGPTALPFRVITGPMASGNAVVSDVKSWDRLRPMGQRKVLGLEMEAAALTRVAHSAGQKPWVVMKGVSDFASPSKSDRYKTFAERASAEALFAFLTDRIADGTLLSAAPGLHRSNAPPRVLRAPPMAALGPIQNRSSELKSLKGWINAPQPAVAVLTGPRNIGKSAVVDKLFHELPKTTDLDLEYAAYLSGTAYMPITPAAILGLLRETLPAARDGEPPPHSSWEDPLGWLETLDVLAGTLRTKVLIVVDQLEELCDVSGRLRDEGLARLFQAIDERSTLPIKLMLVGREDLDMDRLGVGKAERIRMATGLSRLHARNLLRDMLTSSLSSDVTEADEATVASMVDISGGEPRILELLYALACYVGPAQAVTLAGERPPGARLEDHLAGLVVSGLCRADREVLRAVAALALPVPCEAVAAVSGGSESVVTTQLDMLGRRRIIRVATDSRGRSTYYVPPAPGGDEFAETGEAATPRKIMLRRSADYYARNQESHPARMENMHAHFARLQALLAMGAGDEALALMYEMDTYLGRWGRRDALINSRKQIHDRLSRSQQVHNLSCVALALDQQGEHQESIRFLKKAKALCGPADGEATATLTIQMATAYLNLGKHKASLRQLEQAELLTRRHDLGSLQLSVVSTLCARLIEVARFEEAIDLANHSLAAADEAPSDWSDAGKQEAGRQRAHLRFNLAIALGELGEEARALECLREARDMARAYGDDRTAMLSLTAMASREVLGDGQGSHGLDLAMDAAEQARISGNLPLSRGAYLTLALAHLRSGATDAALAAARAATRYDSRAKAVGAWSILGLVSYRAEEYHEAADAFNKTLNGARELINRSPANYQAHEAMALACLGLSLCPEWAQTSKSMRKQARKHFDAHRRITRGARGPALHVKVLATELTTGLQSPTLARFLEDLGLR